MEKSDTTTFGLGINVALCLIVKQKLVSKKFSSRNLREKLIEGEKYIFHSSEMEFEVVMKDLILDETIDPFLYAFSEILGRRSKLDAGKVRKDSS